MKLADRVAIVTGSTYQIVDLPADGPLVESPNPNMDVTLNPDSTVEIETFPRRYITVDGVPIGQPIDDSRVVASRPSR